MHPVEKFSDSSADDCKLPAAKTARGAATDGHGPVPGASVPLPGVLTAVSYRTSSSLPTFASRNSYAKLSFDGNPSTDTKLRWLSAVNKVFQLQRDLAEVKMAAITLRFVYISRQRTDIIERVKSGEFLSLSLIPHDAPDLALRKAVHSLVSRCTAIEDCFAALDARIDGLVAVHTATATKLATLVESRQAVMSTVATITERMDTVASRLERLCDLFPVPSTPSTGHSSTSSTLSTLSTSTTSSRSLSSKHKVRW
ncbi:hypothetical protein E2C01_027268 [Portunus trituberculatus]|uniref:Uncharacterized protein n=1 Tax=Portunus trituberculatus TaxID=210409 RepID=A0A5B7EHG1_PORTR|nr:hypothetical protein [Portunus trituberculatus]